MNDLHSRPKNIAVLGAGSWGTALSVLLCKNGHNVSLWEFFKERAEKIDATRLNPEFLPGVEIPQQIEISSDLNKTVSEKDVIIIVVPSHIVRSVGEKLTRLSLPDCLIVSASKGIENDTLLRMTEVIRNTIPAVDRDNIAVLSGPSHAEEVGKGLPTVVVAASSSTATACTLQEIFMNPSFRVYTNSDVVGVELGGSFKNVIAVAAGISDGVGFGDNTKAALLNRGIVEIIRLGVAMGADKHTFAGLTGMGDLIVTCTSKFSRNRYLGEQIGKGKKLKKVTRGMVQVAEGIRTTRSVYDLSRKYRIDMPISTEVYRVLFKNKDPKQAVYDLMTRDPKKEVWG